jgi:hypothetical protein
MKDMENSKTGFGDIKPSEKVCYNCKYLAWMIGVGQGLRCSHHDNQDKLQMIPNMKHTCEKFEINPKIAEKLNEI